MSSRYSLELITFLCCQDCSRPAAQEFVAWVQGCLEGQREVLLWFGRFAKWLRSLREDMSNGLLKICEICLFSLKYLSCVLLVAWKKLYCTWTLIKWFHVFFFSPPFFYRKKRSVWLWLRGMFNFILTKELPIGTKISFYKSTWSWKRK